MREDLNSSGIRGWADARDNPGFPFHSFKGNNTTCEICGLIRYKAVHSESVESEKRRETTQ